MHNIQYFLYIFFYQKECKERHKIKSIFHVKWQNSISSRIKLKMMKEETFLCFEWA